MRPSHLVLALVLASALPLGRLHAGEHPEHPTGQKAKTAGCSLDDVAGAANQWAVSAKTLKIRDAVAKKNLDLTFMKIHKERLSRVGEDRYFVCSDYKSANGTIYDIDLFMKGKDKANLVPDGQPTIHKVNGVPRYDWALKDGLWVQVPPKAKATKKAKVQP